MARYAFSLALAIMAAAASSARAVPAYKGMSYTSFGSNVLSGSASEFDVTYNTASIPQNAGVTFLNASVAINRASGAQTLRLDLSA